MPRLLHIIFCLLLLPSSTRAHAQEKINEPFCGKKWYCEMTKDSSGKILSPEKGTENNYMYFGCDSNFTLLEGDITLKGKWSFDDATAVLTLSQSQLNTIPEKISFHFIEYDEVHLVMVGQAGTNSNNTVYFITK